MRAPITVTSAIALAAASLPALTGCYNSRVSNYSMTRGGSSTTVSGGWEFYSGALVVRSNQPGVVMGTQKAPGGGREFAYVILFRHKVQRGSDLEVSDNSRIRTTGRIVTMNYGHLLNGRLLDLVMELEKDEANSALKTKTLVVNGNTYDPREGRLFLVDDSEGRVTQVKASLPSDVPKLGSSSRTRELARQVIEKVSSENKVVQEFLDEG